MRPAEVEFIPNQDFLSAKNRAKFCTSMSGFADLETASRYVGTSIEGMCAMPLLTKAQEQHLFRQMNCLKYEMNLKVIDYQKRRNKKLVQGQYDRLNVQMEAIRHVLHLCNVRLMVSIIKKQRIGGELFLTRFSDGMMTLLKCVDRFDYSRNWKFATYVTTSAWRNFSRTMDEEWVHNTRFMTTENFPHILIEEDQEGRLDREDSKRRVAEAIAEIGKYSPRMATIICRRHGIGTNCPESLEQIGKDFKITKERVRQIQNVGTNRLKQILEMMK